MEQQTGRTKQQMLDAPYAAVFVWCNQHTAYPIALAHNINRSDLQIVSPSWLDQRNTRGHEFVGIVVDHAADLGEDQIYALRCARIKAANTEVVRPEGSERTQS